MAVGRKMAAVEGCSFTIDVINLTLLFFFVIISNNFNVFLFIIAVAKNLFRFAVIARSPPEADDEAI
jgi:hypothetical protein